MSTAVDERVDERVGANAGDAKKDDIFTNRWFSGIYSRRERGGEVVREGGPGKDWSIVVAHSHAMHMPRVPSSRLTSQLRLKPYGGRRRLCNAQSLRPKASTRPAHRRKPNTTWSYFDGLFAFSRFECSPNPPPIFPASCPTQYCKSPAPASIPPARLCCLWPAAGCLARCRRAPRPRTPPAASSAPAASCRAAARASRSARRPRPSAPRPPR